MAQTRRSTTSHTNRRTGNNRNMRSNRAEAAYVYDNVARNLSIQEQLEEAPRKKLSHETRKNRET